MCHNYHKNNLISFGIKDIPNMYNNLQKATEKIMRLLFRQEDYQISYVDNLKQV